MDNETIMKVLIDNQKRTYWIKPIGIPGDEPDLRAVYTQPQQTVEFSSKPDSIRLGDILIVYRIGVSKVIFLGECITEARPVTPQEISRQPWKSRWPWTVELRNISPSYGKVWSRMNLKPFSLAEDYSLLNPEDKLNLGSLQFGSDKLAVSTGFGEYVLRKIMRQAG